MKKEDKMSRYEEIKETIECAKGNCVTRLNFDTTELDYLIDIIEKQKDGYDKIIDINANNKVTHDARMEIVRIAQEYRKLTE